MNLLDANVWFAGAWDGHVDHEKAAEWRDRAEGPLIICRVTEMSLLRLLSNRAAMGSAALTRRQAWAVVTKQIDDPSVDWMDEPGGFEAAWRALSAQDDHNHKLWTDDYLAAFAQAAGARLVTLDRAMAKRYPSVDVVTI